MFLGENVQEKVIILNNIPLFFPTKNAARQGQVELWLDFAQIVKELGITAVSAIPQTKPEQLAYIS